MAGGLGLERKKLTPFSKHGYITNDIIAFEYEHLIKPVTLSNVLAAVKDNERASKIAKNGDLQRALRIYNKEEE